MYFDIICIVVSIVGMTYIVIKHWIPHESVEDFERIAPPPIDWDKVDL